MNRLCVIGATYRSADAPLLGELTLAGDETGESLRRVANALGARGLLYLATCNRVELVLDVPGHMDPMYQRARAFEALAGRAGDARTIKETFRIWGGEGAVEHLFLVASGMDSAQLGEREIYLQFKKSLRASREAGTCTPLIDRVVVEALRTARTVHSEIAANNSGNVRSLAQIASDKVRAHVKSVSGRRPRIALVGVSPMTRSCFDALIDGTADLVVTNRTPETAQALVQNSRAECQDLGSFRDDPGPLDAVISAISIADPVITERELNLIQMANGHRGTLFVDMGVPPNVDPDAAEALGFARVGMQDIIEEAQSSRDARRLEMADARRRVDEGVSDLRLSFAERIAAPVVAGLNDQYKEALGGAVDWLLRRELSHLPEEDKAKIRSWSDVVARRCAHIPIMGAKALAAEQKTESLDTFLSASKDDLVESLAKAVEDLDDLDVDLPEAAE